MLSRAFDHICMEKARYKFFIIIIIIIIIIINVTQKINGIFLVCLFVFFITSSFGGWIPTPQSNNSFEYLFKKQ